MGALAQSEQRRLVIQAKVDSSKSQAERNRLGQFATPTGLAGQMLDCAKRLFPPAAKVRFLDPGFGTGSFYSALLRAFPGERIEAAEGFEIDPQYGKPAMELWGHTGLRVRIEDFTRAKPPPTDAGRFNLVVCNPPYVRHHHVASDEKLRLQALTKEACGEEIGGLAGLYCYFLGLAHAWMADGGLAGWLIPSEFMDVNYGKRLKHYLLSRVTLVRIHRFDPSEVQFGDALVSSAIVFFRKTKPSPDHQVEFTFGGTLTKPRQSRMVSATILYDEPKWTRFPEEGERESGNGGTLGDFFTIKRGIATGDNHFFVLAKEQIKARSLPMVFFRPILPSPRFLPADEIQADEDGNPRLDPQLFLLDCRLPEEEVRSSHPALWDYLREGRGLGVHERYLCRHRDPWYAQEDRPPAPFLCTYMGRSDSRNGRAFRFILNHSQATAANVYLLLYPKPKLASLFRGDPDMTRKVWQALNGICPQVMLGEGRVYGGGLYKLEPKELGNVSAETIGLPSSGMADGRVQQLSLFG